MLAYVAASWAVRYDNRLHPQDISLVYPLDTFSMYGGMPGEDRSQLLVRDAQGTVHHVTDFRAFDCAEPVTGPDVHCAHRLGIPYHYEDLARYIEEHRGAGESEVVLITRTWEFSRTAPPLTSDCVVAHCRVSR